MRKTGYTAFLCCLTGLFFACGHNHLGGAKVKRYNPIDSLLAKIDTVTAATPISELLFYNEIADSISEKKDLYFLYIVNADCSNCIANFFRFIDQVNSSNSSLKIFAVVNTLYNKNLSFYAKQYRYQLFFQTICVSEDCWNNKVMTDFYELYLIKGNSIVKQFLTYPFLE